MATLPLPDVIVKRLRGAKEDRALQALTGLQTGTMTVTREALKPNSIRAIVKSGDKHYAVQLHDRGVDCSCPSFQFDRTHSPCKHILATAFSIERK